MITAEEFLKKDNGFDDEDIKLLIKSLKTKNIMDISDIYVTMIEFAKIHVQAAIEAAFENSQVDWIDGEYWETNEKSILNAYSLTNIK